MKSKWVSFFLCLFFGCLGIHKFYEGRVLLGIVYLLTGGLCGIGVLFDLVILFFKPNPYFP
jgi:restriction system protein